MEAGSQVLQTQERRALGLTVPAPERCLRRCKAARKSLEINIRTEAQHGHRIEACFTPKRLWTRLLFGLKRRPQQLPETLCRAMSWGHLPCLLPAAGWVSSLFTPKKTTNKNHDLKAQQWRLTCSPSPTVRNYSFQLNNLLRKIYSRLPAAIQLPASQWRGKNTHPSIHPPAHLHQGLQMKPSLVLSQTRTEFEQSQGSGSWEHWDQGDGILQLLQGHSGLGGEENRAQGHRSHHRSKSRDRSSTTFSCRFSLINS